MGETQEEGEMKKTGKKRGFSTGGEEPITGGKTVGCPMKEQLKKTGESRLFAEKWGFEVVFLNV